MKKEIDLSCVPIDGEEFFKISNHDRMDPFLMSIVSDGNHWMFVSSNGGLSAGRKNPDFSIFPYYTDDKLTELCHVTGSKSVFRVKKDHGCRLWEPFSDRNGDKYVCTRNLYKNIYGNKIMFEEINHDLELAYRYQWCSSNGFGFVRDSWLINRSGSSVEVELLDGVQNIMPHGVDEGLQAVRSNLVDAYKRSELDAASGVGIYSLSAIIVDRAEPSEALKANVAWSLGFQNAAYLLCADQLQKFRAGDSVVPEDDVKARKGAYLINASVNLGANAQRNWRVMADVAQGASDIVALIESIKLDNGGLSKKITEDIQRGASNLKALVSSVDGFQKTSGRKRDARHFSNVLFNIMRGGVFDDNYKIGKADFISYLKGANKGVAQSESKLLDGLPDGFSAQELYGLAMKSGRTDFVRLAMEYLPLKFSRRHGDPSRPWNRFSINTESEDGSKILDYEGNWRDIFQNWESLAHAYPGFIDGMIFKFLNAGTFDGYNPYRITKGGFDWEVIEESDPWSYIGYWGDHQIIYLLKFLEISQSYFPGKLRSYFSKDLFVYANVPYKIKSYDEILRNPKDTISYDGNLDGLIRKQRDAIGADGALLANANSEIHRVNFIEKTLASVLAKLSNFIPEGGIWMNTQRPEWNDANNALVGNGVSMVTLCYLRRFLNFFKNLIDPEESGYALSEELHGFFDDINGILKSHAPNFTDRSRKAVVDRLGVAGEKYRNKVYAGGFSGAKQKLLNPELISFLGFALEFLDRSIAANKREDGMYHAYNLMTIKDGDEISIGRLDEMLEGQVAVLSSGCLSPEEALDVLDAMKAGRLFREDQYSYILCPNKELPKFLAKNLVPENKVMGSSLLRKLLSDQNSQVIEKDVKGNYHFNGSFNNADSLRAALDGLPDRYRPLVEAERGPILEIFEEVFDHKSFTGRSGTFFGYEGLGSIYWHMVSKLLLAVHEVCLKAMDAGQSEECIGRLIEHFHEINEGIGIDKPPELYGAFPTDPYSHTPFTKGAQQPGMTGQVKEDILSRMGELGILVAGGKVSFRPRLLKESEFLDEPSDFSFIDMEQEEKTIALKSGSLAFTFCQVPVVYEKSDANSITVYKTDGDISKFEGSGLDGETSGQVFGRAGGIEKIVVRIIANLLK